MVCRKTFFLSTATALYSPPPTMYYSQRAAWKSHKQVWSVIVSGK
jgi:hypothetical protein